jgi:TolB-like protein
LAWIYERGPEGIIRTASAEAAENPLPETKKKPFTGTLTILVLSVILVAQFIYFTFIRDNNKRLLPEEVLSEKVAVAPFNNFTGKEDLDAFGLMSSEWITSGLRELDVKTSSPEMMRKYRDNVGVLPGNPDQEVSLFELTGAKYVVTGSFYENGSQIEVSSRLESTESGDVIYNFPSLKATGP